MKSDKLKQQLDQLTEREDQLAKDELAALNSDPVVGAVIDKIRRERLVARDNIRPALEADYASALHEEANQDSDAARILEARQADPKRVEKVEQDVAAVNADALAAIAAFDETAWARNEREVVELAKALRGLSARVSEVTAQCDGLGITPPPGLRMNKQVRDYCDRVKHIVGYRAG